MSSQTRRYEQKARADSQRETRDRIARSAAELHEEIGVAQTTVAEIARRAGVTRLTVYNHFPDLTTLLPACAAHYESLHPRPDVVATLGPAGAGTDATGRVAAALTRLYGWYRETESLLSRAFGDRVSVPELDQFLAETLDPFQADLATALAATFERPRKDVRTLAWLAVDFWTWRRLTAQGTSDAAAARLMASTIAGAGER